MYLLVQDKVDKYCTVDTSTIGGFLGFPLHHDECLSTNYFPRGSMLGHFELLYYSAESGIRRTDVMYRTQSPRTSPSSMYLFTVSRKTMAWKKLLVLWETRNVPEKGSTRGPIKEMFSLAVLLCLDPAKVHT